MPPEPSPKKSRRKQSTVGGPIKNPVLLPDREETLDDAQIDAFEERIARQAEEDQKKLEEFQSQFGGQQYYVRVEKYNTQENEFEIVDKIFFDTFDSYTLGKKYGGGRFMCTLLDSKGRYVAGGRFHFNFAKAAEPEKNSPVASDPMQNPMILMILENMRADKAAMMELMKTMATGEKQTPIDQLVNALKGLHDMNPKEKSENPMKSLKELLEVQALLSDRGDDDKGGGTGIVSEIMEALKALNATKQVALPPGSTVQPPRLAPQTRIMSTGGTPILERPSAPPLKEEKVVNQDPIYRKLAPHIPQFVEAATDNAPPEKWASYLVEVLDTQIVPMLVKQYSMFGVDEDDIWEKLLTAAESQDTINKIYEFAPELAPYADWVNAVIAASVASFNEEPAATNGLNGDVV